MAKPRFMQGKSIKWPKEVKKCTYQETTWTIPELGVLEIPKEIREEVVWISG